MMKLKLYGWGPFALINLVLVAVLLVIDETKTHFPFRTYSGMLIAMSAGFLGATFSMLIQNQSRVSQGSLEHLNVCASWHMLIVRASVGLGAAVILYFFFESGLLEGSLWPDLEELGYNRVKLTEQARVPNKQLCLLIIWCFLAGFSETFVPSILQKTEQKGSTI